MQSKLPNGTDALITEANYLVQVAHQDAKLGICIRRYVALFLELFTFRDAAWGTRPDGFSHGGVLTFSNSIAHSLQVSKL